MLQWILRFSEFTEFNESSAPFRENSIEWLFLGKLEWHNWKLDTRNMQTWETLLSVSSITLKVL